MFERDGAILTGAINNIGDLPLHTSMVTSFAYGANFPPEHSQFTGARLTYPFLADFISAFFIRTGVSLTTAMYLQTVFLMVALPALGYRWALKLTRDRLAAVISVGLLLLSGGFGWWLFGDDVPEERRPVASGSHAPVPRVYNGNLLWLSLGQHARGDIASSTQFPVRLAAFDYNHDVVVEAIEAPRETHERDRTERWSFARFRLAISSYPMRRMLGAGAITGLLPLAHTTTFGVMMGMAACLALLLRRWQRWAAFFAAALLVALPQVWWFGHGSSVQPRNMFAWQIGWDKGSANFWWFWFKNTGLFIPALAIALVWGASTRTMSRRFLLSLRSVPSLFHWSKFTSIDALDLGQHQSVNYWYIAAVPLVAILLARIWRARILGPLAAAILFICMTAAGALDVWRVLAKSNGSI